MKKKIVKTKMNFQILNRRKINTTKKTTNKATLYKFLKEKKD